MFHGFHKAKQVLQQINLCGNKSSIMSNEKSKLLDNINDVLIVRKIEPVCESCEGSFEDVWDSDFSSKFDGEEQNLLADEYEAIVRKQLQMLQADERGKQALISEIAAIKQKQKKRIETLKNRQRALDIEKERSKKIASLPPPLPKSVKSLLKKYDDEALKTCCSETDVQMPDELTAISIKPAQIDSEENKENIIDPIELEAKERMQEEWNLKAKKRFNEALKKDRQKEEYANIMRQIQSAELQNRREMAKKISSEKLKNVPCPISDKFQTVKKQTDMEDAAEKLFKKHINKEHVIEEIEGYQDHYEAKYGKIDSEYEAKMIDCVPSFVKENYEYLLEEESKFRGGKNFSGLDDSGSDVLNQAYIETPPAADEVDGRTKIDIAIDQLDKLRSELQTEYDQTVKPLLVAAIESPKQEVLDKAVETDALKVHAEDKAVEADILKLPTEVKAVETDISAKSKIISPPREPFVSFKRKHQGPFFHPYQDFFVPDMHQRDVRYALPTSSAEELAAGSWSTSSYCSLPSKHGIPNLHSSSGSVKCDICVAESENIKDTLLTKHPKSSSADTEDKNYKSVKSDNIVPSDKIASKGKSSLSEYVKQLAEKYMKPKTTALETLPKEVAKEYPSGSILPDCTTAMTPAFVKEMICKSTVGSFPSDPQVSGKSLSSPEKQLSDVPSSSIKLVFDEIHDIEQKSTYGVDDKSKKENAHFDDILQVNLQQKDSSEVKGSGYFDSPTEYDIDSEYDAEVKRLQLIHQVLSRKIPRFSFALSPTRADIDQNDAQPESAPLTSGHVLKRGTVVKPHIYHELSTIQEADSALTAGSLHMSKSSLLPESSFIESEENMKDEGKVDDSDEKLIIASLLDPPDSKISELAKSIHFVADTCEKGVQPLEIQQIPSAESLDAIAISTDSVSTPSSSMPTSELSSSVSDEKIITSTLARKHGKSSFLKDAKVLPLYFKDVSGLQHATVSNCDSSVKSHTTSALTLSRPPSPLSSSSQSIPSVVEIKMKEAKDDKLETISSDRLVSGYITDKVMIHSSMPTSKLSSSVSDEKIFTSTLARKHGKYSFLKDAKVLPLYFKDISGLQHATVSNSDSSVTSHITSALTLSRPPSPLSSSSQSIPSVVEIKVEEAKDDKPETISSDPLVSGYITDKIMIPSSSSDVFLPMTPHFDVSSPYNHSNKYTPDVQEEKLPVKSKEIQYDHLVIHSPSVGNNEGFKTLTTCSSISSPSEYNVLTPRPEQENNESFEVVTTHSNFIPPRKPIFFASRHQDYAINAESFQPLSFHSISSPVTSESIHLKERNVSTESSKFYPLTLRSDTLSSQSASSDDANGKKSPVKKIPQINYHVNVKAQTLKSIKHMQSPKVLEKELIISSDSSVSKRKAYKEGDQMQIKDQTSDKMKQKVHPYSSDFFVPRIDVASIPDPERKNTHELEEGTISKLENNGNFKIMTADSNVSSQESANFVSRHQGYAESFNPLSPQSIPSSLANEDIHLKVNTIPSKTSEFCPMTFRFDILTSQSASPDDINTKISPVENLPQITCRVDMKSQTLKPLKHLQSLKVSEKELITISDSNIREKQNYSEGKASNQIKIKEHISSEKRTKEKAYPCSSDFFVPHIDVADLTDFEIKNNHELIEGTISKKLDTNETELKSLSDPSISHSGVSGSSSGVSSEKFKEINHPSEGATNYFKKPWGKNGGKSLKESIVDSYQKEYFLGSEMVKGVKKQYTNLKAVSSSSSSSENLSDMFSGSKIIHQSTPIKSLEEIMQETGIMEEPNLTLITTEISCKPDSLEIPRDFSLASSTNPVADNFENDCTLESSKNEVKTPSRESPQFLGFTDTPSMLSFLRHENSCMQTENSGSFQSSDTTDTPSVKENQNENQRHHRFPKVEYKLRTKRLWNNLEEVKKKNLAEERKKLLVANRLKAKEFSKKVTPKRREK